MSLACVVVSCCLHIVSCLKWKKGSMELPTHLLKPAYATIDEHTLYVFGGYDAFIEEYSYFIYKSNIKQHESGWMTLSTRIPSAIQCYECTAIVNGTLIYIFTQYLNTIYIFDTINNIFLNNSYISSPLYPIYTDSLSVTNDINQRYIYIVSYDSITNKTYLQIYDSNTNQWSIHHQLSVPYITYGYTSIVSYYNTILLFGGYYQHNTLKYLNCICQYTIIENNWLCNPNITLSERKYGTSAVVDYNNNVVYIIGGFGGGDLFSNKVDVYNPITNTIENDTNLPNIGGNNMIVSIMYNKIVIFGGWDKATYSMVKTSLFANLTSDTQISTTKYIEDIYVFDVESKIDDEYMKLLVMISGSIIGVLLVFSLIYLLFFTAKRSRDNIHQMSWISFITNSSVLLKVSIVFCVMDSVSDYIFATSLLGYLRFGEIYTSTEMTLMAWISLICGIIGLLLCICWLLVARKLYAKIPILSKQLIQYQQIKDRSLNVDLRIDILKEIRIRKVDVDIFGILIACLDIAQITIIIIVNKILIKEWTTPSMISLSLCFISCSLKFLNIIIDGMGCNDEYIDVNNDDNGIDNKDGDDVVIVHREDSDDMTDNSEMDKFGDAAYERHISIIRNNGDELDEENNVIHIERNDDIKHIIENARTAMGIDGEEEMESRHILLNGEESHSYHESSYCQGNYIDL